jgi:hypothetical protein
MAEDKAAQSAWKPVAGKDASLAQGDFLPRLVVPIIPPDSWKLFMDEKACNHQIPVIETAAVVLTQTCDLKNNKVSKIVICRAFEITEFEKVNTDYKAKGRWDSVGKGRERALYLLPGLSEAHDTPIVVYFSDIHILDGDFVRSYVKDMDGRYQLTSPYRESLSQRFGTFFSQVALPATVK